MALFPSERWLRDWVDKINESTEFEQAAANWEGDISYAFVAQPGTKLTTDVWVWMDLAHGKCRDSKWDVGAEQGAKARLVLSAPYSRWKEVINQELDPVKGIMLGKIKLKGDLATMIRHVKAAKAIAKAAGAVETEFMEN